MCFDLKVDIVSKHPKNTFTNYPFNEINIRKIAIDFSKIKKRESNKVRIIKI